MYTRSIVELDNNLDERVCFTFEADSLESAINQFDTWAKNINKTHKTFMLIPHNNPKGYLFPRYYENNVSGYCYSLH